MTFSKWRELYYLLHEIKKKTGKKIVVYINF